MPRRWPNCARSRAARSAARSFDPRWWGTTSRCSGTLSASFASLFFEQRYQVEKLTESQRDAYKRLARLHLDRRRQARERASRRQDEARLDSQRADERQRRRRELEAIETAMAKLNAADAIAKVAESNQASTQSREVVQPADEALTDEIYAAAAAAAETGSQKDEEVVTLTSRVLEIDRASYRTAATAAAAAEDVEAEEMRPLIRSRSKSFIREASGGLRLTSSEVSEPAGDQQGAIAEEAPAASAPRPSTPLPPLTPQIAPIEPKSSAKAKKQVTIVESANEHLPPIQPSLSWRSGTDAGLSDAKPKPGASLTSPTSATA